MHIMFLLNTSLVEKRMKRGGRGGEKELHSSMDKYKDIMLKLKEKGIVFDCAMSSEGAALNQTYSTP